METFYQPILVGFKELQTFNFLASLINGNKISPPSITPVIILLTS